MTDPAIAIGKIAARETILAHAYPTVRQIFDRLGEEASNIAGERFMAYATGSPTTTSWTAGAIRLKELLSARDEMIRVIESLIAEATH
jgi:hypothetical protein